MKTTVSPACGAIALSIARNSSGHPWMSPTANSRPCDLFRAIACLVFGVVRQQPRQRRAVGDQAAHRAIGVEPPLAHFADKPAAVAERPRAAFLELCGQDLDKFARTPLALARRVRMLA